MKRFAFVASISAAIAYFFDPKDGARRRDRARDRAVRLFRRLERTGRGTAVDVREEPKEYDDGTLARTGTPAPMHR